MKAIQTALTVGREILDSTDQSAALARDSLDSPPEISRSVQVPTGLSVSERVRLMRDGLIHYGGFLSSGLLGIVVVPIMLHGLGEQMYGLWVAMSSLIAIASVADLGLGWTVVREVSMVSYVQGGTSQLIPAARSGFLALGIVGAILLCLAGLGSSNWINIPAAGHKTVESVFALGGVAFVANSLIAFARSTMQGRRRFDLVTLLSTVYSVVWCISIVAVLTTGGRILAIAVTYAAVSAGTAVLALVLTRSGVGLLGSWALPRPKVFRSHLRFSVGSQFVALLTTTVGELGPLMIGKITGASSIASYQVGRKFPIAVALMGWSMCGVLFPAGAQSQKKQDGSRRETLEVGMRWVMVMIAPFCLALFVLAPSVIRIWIGTDQRDAAVIMRILMLWVLVTSPGEAALYFLWGSGRTSTLAAIAAAELAGYLMVGALLIRNYGAIGAAWAFLIVLGLGSLAVIVTASQLIDASFWHLIRNSCEGVVISLLLCSVVIIVLIRIASPSSWYVLIAYAGATLITYLSAFYTFGARPEDRALIGEIIRFGSKIVPSLQHQIQLGWQLTASALGSFIRKV